MNQTASFWDNPDAADDSPVIRHADDQNNYHYPEAEQLRHMPRMRGSRSGRFAVIPAANRDGTSKGFDAEEPGVVHVDPDAPDGGTIVDLANVTKQSVRQAVDHSTYPHQAYYQLGTPAPLFNAGIRNDSFTPRREETRVNPISPGQYVVPKAAQDGGQLRPVTVAGPSPSMPMANPGFIPMHPRAQEEQMPVQPLPMPSVTPPVNSAMPVAMPQQHQAPPPPASYPGYPPPAYPQQQQYPYTPGFAPMAPPPMDPNLQAMLTQMAGTMNNLAGAVSQLQQEQQRGFGGPPNTPNPKSNRLATMPVGGNSGAPAVPPLYPIGTAPSRRRRRDEDDDSNTFDDSDLTPIGERRAEDDEEDRQTNRSLVRQRQRQNQQRVRDVQDDQHPDNAVITGFETLRMPFVTGPVARKASRAVVFDFKQLGKHQAKFHDVIVGETCIVLIYDTRYEDGQQYLPPDLREQELEMHVPHLKKTFTIQSMGLNYSCGVFDHIVLIKQDEIDLGQPE